MTQSKRRTPACNILNILQSAVTGTRAEAQAAFQKTASDMEQERSNLMCVINQAGWDC